VQRRRAIVLPIFDTRSDALLCSLFGPTLSSRQTMLDFTRRGCCDIITTDAYLDYNSMSATHSLKAKAILTLYEGITVEFRNSHTTSCNAIIQNEAAEAVSTLLSQGSPPMFRFTWHQTHRAIAGISMGTQLIQAIKTPGTPQTIKCIAFTDFMKHKSDSAMIWNSKI